MVKVKIYGETCVYSDGVWVCDDEVVAEDLNGCPVQHTHVGGEFPPEVQELDYVRHCIEYLGEGKIIE